MQINFAFILNRLRVVSHAALNPFNSVTQTFPCLRCSYTRRWLTASVAHPGGALSCLLWTVLESTAVMDPREALRKRDAGRSAVARGCQRAASGMEVEPRASRVTPWAGILAVEAVVRGCVNILNSLGACFRGGGGPPGEQGGSGLNNGQGVWAAGRMWSFSACQETHGPSSPLTSRQVAAPQPSSVFLAFCVLMG